MAYACIDIGSNTTRLLVAEVEDGTLRELAAVREFTLLGSAAGADGSIPHAKVAEKLEYWVKKHGLAGMRFSPIYYLGKDEWLNAKSSHALWKKAEELKAIFNFFIATPQLPKLEDMVRRFPKVRVVIDHLARADLKAAE